MENIYNIYKKNSIENLGIYSLRKLEEKVLKSLNYIKERKQECNYSFTFSV